MNVQKKKTLDDIISAKPQIILQEKFLRTQTQATIRILFHPKILIGISGQLE